LDHTKLPLLDLFQPFAQKLLESSQGDPQLALCKTFALLSGYTSEQQARSLLANIPGYITVQVHCNPGSDIRSRGFVKRILAESLKVEESTLAAKDIRLSEDGGAVIDIPQETAELLIKNEEKLSSARSRRYTWTRPSQLPPLKDDDGGGTSNGFSSRSSGAYGYSGSNGYRGGSSSRGGFSRGGFSRSGGSISSRGSNFSRRGGSFSSRGSSRGRGRGGF